MMQYKQFIPLFLALAGAVQAAELGDVAPRSYIGQPLAVDIELVSLTPEEALNLPVRLAQADVYRGANTAINPALSSVRMQVEKRGQRQILHVTTTRAVEAEYLHLYLELGLPGKSEVRLATVWLQRDPNPPPPAPVQVAAVTPAAPPVPPASAMTPAQAEQITAQARAARAEAAKAEATKAEAAKAELAKAELAKAEAAAARERAKPAPLPSVHEAETGKPGEVKAAGQPRRIAGVLVGGDGKPVAPSAREETAEVPVGVSQALLPLAPLPLPKGVKRPAPASCAPTGMSAKECVALDARNTEMASKITELEGKLKALQGALAGGAAPAAAQTAKPGVPAAAAATAAPAVGQAAKPGAQAGGAASPAAHAASAAAKPDAASAAGKNGAATAVNAAAGHAVQGSVADKAGAKTASAGASGSGAAAAGGTSSAGEDGGKDGKGAASALASASLSAQGETEAHAAKAAGASASASAASASASGEAAASAAASVPTKQVRVLPKLKYKKEKEKPAESSGAMLPLIGGGIGLLALLGGGFVFLRKRSAGKGPLKIWQGFRKKKADAPTPEPAAEATPESVA
jgi:pilus assembly protein FimV